MSFQHGGHEMFDVQEVLSGAVSLLNTYKMTKEMVQDVELKEVIDRQVSFLTQEYNTLLEAFQTGSKPTVSLKSYMMKMDHSFTYGLKESEPVTPITEVTDMNDQHVSSLLLGMMKSSASLRAMTALEMTNPVVRRVVADSVPNAVEMAYELSLYQNHHGYYQVPQLPTQDMQKMMNAYGPSSNTVH
ncbi:spore gernimation protein GerQ [Priestia koreensis]|uniref:Spore gernimation protein GerQ n=2 Tax=Priestia koreensis TaxID=284581 RepID=A0A0M0L9H5_9BACI|nr:spore gernimation protein GerQ [Priestia koreensis]